jgi:thiosulfate reductase cytochrome b subunit
MWHFFGMWIFFINGMVWFFYNLLSKHGWRTTIFNKADLPGILPMIQYYLRIRKVHPPVKKYNALQKLAYTTISFVGIGSILTGIAIYWPAQFSGITWLFGGYDTARIWHFAFMFALVTFFLGHLAMVAIAGWWNFVAIITGWKRIVYTPALDSQQSKEPRLPSDDKTDSPRNVDLG